MSKVFWLVMDVSFDVLHHFTPVSSHMHLRQGELRGFHSQLIREQEQLQKEKEQLREKELVLLRLAAAPGSYRSI